MNFQHSLFLEHEERRRQSKTISLYGANLPIFHVSTEQKYPAIAFLNLDLEALVCIKQYTKTLSCTGGGSVKGGQAFQHGVCRNLAHSQNSI